MDNEREPMTYDEHEALLIQVSNANGDVGSMTEALQSLRENYRMTRDSYDANRTELEALNEKYKKLEQRNLDLFMRVSAEDKKDEENEDIEKDNEIEDLTYDDLFNERQGG
nr:MAG TPA: Phi29 scaffolding protein [Caudoviricetes sp.]